MMGNWESLGNPSKETEEVKNITFWSQSTYVLPVVGIKDAFIFIADRWIAENHIDGRYISLPV